MLDMSNLWIVLNRLFSDYSYGQSLEGYIASRNPQDTSDVERLEREFNQRIQRNNFFGGAV